MHALADDFRGRPAEHLLGAAVPFGDVALSIPQDEGERCRVVERPEAQLAIAQCRLGLLLLGDVVEGDYRCARIVSEGMVGDAYLEPVPQAAAMTQAQGEGGKAAGRALGQAIQ